MNIIKQSISKKFTRKYCSKSVPAHILCQVGQIYGGVFVVSVLGGGIYGSYVGLKKWNGFNEDVIMSCVMGIICGVWLGVFSPFIIPGYLIKKISDTIE